MRSNASPSMRGAFSLTRAHRARVPSTPSMAKASRSQRRASRYSPWLIAASARKATTTPLAVNRWTSQAAARISGPLLALLAPVGEVAQAHAADRGGHAGDQAEQKQRLLDRILEGARGEQEHAEGRDEVTEAFHAFTLCCFGEANPERERRVPCPPHVKHGEGDHAKHGGGVIGRSLRSYPS